jgi:hypothetical protein
LAAITVFDDALPAPYAEVTFGSGEVASLTLDRGGLTIKETSTGRVVFTVGPAAVSEICAAMLNTRAPSDVTPLRMLVTLVAQMRSVDEVGNAFKRATAPP